MTYDNKTLKQLFWNICDNLGLNEDQCFTRKLYNNNTKHPSTFIISPEEQELGTIYLLFCAQPKKNGEGKLELDSEHGWTIYKYDTFGAVYNKPKDFYTGSIKYVKKVHTYSQEEIEAMHQLIDPDYQPQQIAVKKTRKATPKTKTAGAPIQIDFPRSSEGRLEILEKLTRQQGEQIDELLSIIKSHFKSPTITIK